MKEQEEGELHGRWIEFIPGGELDVDVLIGSKTEELKGGQQAGNDDLENEEVGALAWKQDGMVNGFAIIPNIIQF